MQKKKNHINRAAVLIMAVLFIYGCVNPYKYLANKPPLTAKDSATLLARCVAIMPVDTSESIQPVIIPQKEDSTAYFKAIADSLKNTKQTIRDSLLIKYRDTCRSAIDTYQEGFNLGYKVGEYEGKSKSATEYKKQLIISDSICVREIRKVKAGYNLRIAAAENAARVAAKDSNRYRNKMDSWKTAFIIAACAAALFLIIAILLWKFRRQAKAANSIINSGQDIVENLKKL